VTVLNPRMIKHGLRKRTEWITDHIYRVDEALVVIRGYDILTNLS